MSNKSWESKLMLSIKDNDKYFYLKDGKVGIIKKINSRVVRSHILEKRYFNSFSSEPDDSKNYEIYIISRSIIETKELQLSYGDVHRKGIGLSLDATSLFLNWD